MSKIEYSLFRLVRNAVFFSVLGLLSLRYLAASERHSGFLVWMVTVALLGAGALMAWKAINDRTALTWDEYGVEITKNFSKLALRWSDVQGINVERVRTLMWGFIPTSSTTWLCFQTAGGLIGTKKHRVTANLLDLPTGGVEALYARLVTAHAGASQRSAPRQVSEYEPAPTGEGLDHDAVIARYLANRDAQAEAPVPAPAPFVAPQRPQFGRRVR